MKLFYFNPGHETAVVNASPYYMPPANVLQMQRDLSFLPAWYGEAHDYVFVPAGVDKDYSDFLRKYFKRLPQAISLAEIASIPNEELAFWGISPQAVYFFAEVNREYNLHLNIPAWKAEYTYLNSREAAKDCLVEIITKLPEISENLIPRFCKNIEEIEHTINATNRGLIAKAPYSSSGRGLLWLSGLSDKEKEFLHGILKKQACVSLEMALDKDTDFSMQFMCDGKGNVRFEGYSLFETNQRGAYQGTFLYNQELISALLTEKIPVALLEAAKNTLLAVLKEKYASLYKACIGVDMMIYKENGTYKLHPCVEINMRYNMGYLSMKLQQNYLAQASKGKFQIEYHSKEGAALERHTELQQHFPLKIDAGKIKNGYLALCPVTEQSRYVAYALVEV